MSQHHDYTIPNGLGVRIIDGKTCQAIRRQRGMWVPIGRPLSLPLHKEDLKWTRNGIPASVIAVALRAYELDHPNSALRSELTQEQALRAAS